MRAIALRRVLDQRRDGGGLRHVVPIFLRHLGPHGPRVHPRGIEHALVIVAPALLETGRWSARPRGAPAGRRRGVRDPTASTPMGVRIVQSSEPKAVDEERRGCFEDEVLGLEPGDEALAILALDPAEAQEGVHLVQIAADRARHAVEPMHQRIARHVEQRALAVQDAPDQAVEQGVALRIAVADDEPDQLADARRKATGGARVAPPISPNRSAPPSCVKTTSVGRDRVGDEAPARRGGSRRDRRRPSGRCGAASSRTGSAARGFSTSRWRRFGRIERWRRDDDRPRPGTRGRVSGRR